MAVTTKQTHFWVKGRNYCQP